MKIQTVSLTPELARHWLETQGVAWSVGNRQKWYPPSRLHQDWIDAYAADMLRGDWRPRTAICFRGGKLTDGQHRCHAVIRSGKTIEVLACYSGQPVPVGIQ
jgi:hypothetical protein